MADSTNVNILEGSAKIQGGLAIQKTKIPTEDGCQAPKESLFGLDKLAGKRHFQLLLVVSRHHF